MPYTPIAGTLGYVLSEDQKKVLLVHRIARDDDDHLGKYNGLGGKMEPHEDLVSCMKREIKEEAGIIPTVMQLRGTINWTNFGPKLQNWLGFVFLITKYEGTIFSESPEGPLTWIDIDQIFDLPLWEGDRHFLPLVFDKDPRIFHGFMPYNGDKVQSWSFSRL